MVFLFGGIEHLCVCALDLPPVRRGACAYDAAWMFAPVGSLCHRPDNPGNRRAHRRERGAARAKIAEFAGGVLGVWGARKCVCVCVCCNLRAGRSSALCDVNAPKSVAAGAAAAEPLRWAARGGVVAMMVMRRALPFA